jgi:ATP-dependent protease Clp ATPase subunit
MRENNQVKKSNHRCSDDLLFAMLLTPYFGLESMVDHLNDHTGNAISDQRLLKMLHNGFQPSGYAHIKDLQIQLTIRKIDRFRENYILSDAQIRTLCDICPALKSHFNINIFSYPIVVNNIKQKVFGQDSAIASLSIYMMQWALYWSGKMAVKPLSLRLMAGPTGCGKTLLASTICNELQVGFISVDGSRLTQEGYVGQHIITEIIMQYIALPVLKQDKVLVFIDEFDKLASCNSNGEIKGLSVLNEMLVLFESDTISGMSNYSKDGQRQSIDISRFCFILGGAFTNINTTGELVINEHGQLVATKQGFNYATIENYGIPKEIMGRIGGVIELNPISRNVIVEILNRDSQSNPLYYHRELFKIFNKDILITDPDIDSICEETLKLDLGIRGLKIVIEKFMERHLKNIFRQ